MTLLASLFLAAIGYTLRCLPRYTKKWSDDRALEQLGSFFYAILCELNPAYVELAKKRCGMNEPELAIA